MKTITSKMMLYYKKPETENEKVNLFFDFDTIHQRVKGRYPESTLYRLLHKRCHTSVRYQNRDLYPYEDIMSIPEISKEMNNDE